MNFTQQYHGGTNFGRTAGGPFITTSYDYDAPIDEYGVLKVHSMNFLDLNMHVDHEINSFYSDKFFRFDSRTQVWPSKRASQSY